MKLLNLLLFQRDALFVWLVFYEDDLSGN